MTETMVPQKAIAKYWRHIAIQNMKLPDATIFEKSEQDLARNLAIYWAEATLNYSGLTVREFSRKFDRTIPVRNYSKHKTYVHIKQLLKMGNRLYYKDFKQTIEQEE